MKSPLIRAATFCFIISISYTAYSQPSQNEDLEKLYGGEDFVSIATGTRQPISKAPAVASVITYDEMKAMGATNLDEVLETVPGLHVSPSSYGFSPIYSIRGIYTDVNPQVLVLVDGTPITQVFAGDRGPQSTLPIEDISRVEIIRGPGSAVYGADAFAGVINVITKQANEIGGTKVGVRAGSFDTQQAWLLHGGKWAGFDVAFNLEWLHSNGDENRVISQDAQSAFDQAFNTSASLASRPGYNYADTRQNRVDLHLDLSKNHWRLHLWNWRQYDNGVGPGVALALDHTGKTDTNNYLVDLSYKNPQFKNNWDMTTKLSYLNLDVKSLQYLYPAGTVLPIGSDGNINTTPGQFTPVLFSDGFIGEPSYTEHHVMLDINSFYNGFNKHRIRLGTGIAYADINPSESKNFGSVLINLQAPVNGTLYPVSSMDLYIPKKSRNDVYGSVQDEWSFARDWDLTAGVRYDHYSDFGSTVNPRAALVWQTRYDLTTKFLYGHAFRAPSFAELFSSNNPIRQGNKDLKPEKIDTLELAFNYQPTFNLQHSLNIFHYWIHDLILLEPTSDGSGFKNQNAGEQNGFGLEWEVNWQIKNNLKLTANYAYQRSENKNTHSDAGSAPHHEVYTRLNWEFLPEWSLVPQIVWIADRNRVANDARPKMKNYDIIDLTLRRENIAEHWEFDLMVKNVFDQNALEPSPYSVIGTPIPNDFPMPGRAFYGEVRYTF